MWADISVVIVVAEGFEEEFDLASQYKLIKVAFRGQRVRDIAQGGTTNLSGRVASSCLRSTSPSRLPVLR